MKQPIISGRVAILVLFLEQQFSKREGYKINVKNLE